MERVCHVVLSLYRGTVKLSTPQKQNGPARPFVFIIDEINRANMSAVLGELLYCLEYRGQPIPQPTDQRLQGFTIPQNVYLIGTMNNLDKSLVTFDLALRRRFAFYDLKPDLAIVSSELRGMIQHDSLERFVEACQRLNESIGTELGLPPEYQIGHAYFMKIETLTKSLAEADGPVKITALDCQKLWDFFLRPLLEEYLGNRVRQFEGQLKNMRNSFCQI